MRSGAVVTIADHIIGAKGKRMRQPGLPGRWCVWSKVSGGPGWHAVTPADDDARATGATFATVRITFPHDVATPDVRLVACEPNTVMPQPVKHQENSR